MGIVPWPGDKRFAFTIFDDPDSQTVDAGRQVYALLADLGFRITKGVWPLAPSRTASDHGATCGDREYLTWVQDLQARGFEIGYHNATSHTSTREETLAGLDAFAKYFGVDPSVMANHYYCDEDIYWGEDRLTGAHRFVYNVLTRGRHRDKFFGHISGHPYFWGDLCRERITYVRNFVFTEVNTLKACPYMPYHDPLRPYVKYWFGSSEGSDVSSFLDRLDEANQDRLEEEGGACIMYTHFGHGYVQDGVLNRRFVSLMERLRRKNGWFVPVSPLLDHLLAARRDPVLTSTQRRELERRWLWDKVRSRVA